MKRRKILLVDDSNTVLMMEKMILSRGFDVVTASNGEDGVQKARTEKPDAILLDVVMPRMNGFDACRRLRDIEETRDTPIIMVTTRGEESNVEVGYAAGCTDYITKPINSGELLAKLHVMLGEDAP